MLPFLTSLTCSMTDLAGKSYFLQVSAQHLLQIANWNHRHLACRNMDIKWLNLSQEGENHFKNVVALNLLLCLHELPSIYSYNTSTTCLQLSFCEHPYIMMMMSIPIYSCSFLLDCPPIPADFNASSNLTVKSAASYASLIEMLRCWSFKDKLLTSRRISFNRVKSWTKSTLANLLFNPENFWRS